MFKELGKGETLNIFNEVVRKVVMDCGVIEKIVANRVKWRVRTHKASSQLDGIRLQ